MHSPGFASGSRLVTAMPLDPTALRHVVTGGIREAQSGATGRPRSKARTSNAGRLASEQARRRPGRLWDTRPRPEARPVTEASKQHTTSSPSAHRETLDQTPSRPSASPRSDASAEIQRRRPPAASRGVPSPSHWTAEEDRQLFHYRDQCDLEWDEVGKRVGGRSGPACRQRYYRLSDAAVSGSCGAPSHWTPEHDRQLVHLRDRRALPWDEVGQRLGGRAGPLCRQRYLHLAEAGVAGHADPARRFIPEYSPSRLAPVQKPPAAANPAYYSEAGAPGPPPPEIRPVPARPVEPGFADSYAAVTLPQGVFRLPPIL